jgi:hypothetical protein
VADAWPVETDEAGLRFRHTWSLEAFTLRAGLCHLLRTRHA